MATFQISALFHGCFYIASGFCWRTLYFIVFYTISRRKSQTRCSPRVPGGPWSQSGPGRRCRASWAGSRPTRGCSSGSRGTCCPEDGTGERHEDLFSINCFIIASFQVCRTAGSARLLVPLLMTPRRAGHLGLAVLQCHSKRRFQVQSNYKKWDRERVKKSCI